MMKNKAKYFSCIIFLFLMALFASASKSKGSLTTHTNNIIAFQAGNHNVCSSAEITPLSYGSLSNLTNSSRRTSRTNSSQTHLTSGGLALVFGSELTPFHSVANSKNVLYSYNKHTGKSFFYTLCCIRI